MTIIRNHELSIYQFKIKKKNQELTQIKSWIFRKLARHALPIWSNLIGSFGVVTDLIQPYFFLFFFFCFFLTCRSLPGFEHLLKKKENFFWGKLFQEMWPTSGLF